MCQARELLTCTCLQEWEELTCIGHLYMFWCGTLGLKVVPTTAVDPFGRPPLPRRRSVSRTVTCRAPLPRKRAVRLRPAVGANQTEGLTPQPLDEPQTGKAKGRRKQAAQPAAVSSAAAMEGQSSSGKNCTGAAGGGGGAAGQISSSTPHSGKHRAGSQGGGQGASKAQPSLRLSEAPRSSRRKTVKNKANLGAAEAVGEGQGQPKETASSSKSAAAKMKTRPVVEPARKTVLGMTPKAKPAAAVQSKMELDDDSYEYYTESTSESQGNVQQPEPDKRARAAYMIAGCVILLFAWCAVVWTKRPVGMVDVLY